MSCCHSEPDEVIQKTDQRQFGLFNRITAMLIIGWVLIVGGAASNAHHVEPAVDSASFIQSLLR